MPKLYQDRLRKQDWYVRDIKLTTAQNLVELLHYAKGGSNTATFKHGLFHVGEKECKGVAWWIPPTKSAAIATYPKNWQGVLSLSRLVVLPGVPKNACSFLMARSIKLISPKRWPCLVTYADEWQGHLGTIYKASGWTEVGDTEPQPVYVLNGRMLSRKAGPTTRTHDEMLALGAEMVGKFSKKKFVIIRG